MKCAFVSGHIPAETNGPYALTGGWAWQRIYKAEILNPLTIERDWSILARYDRIFVPGTVQTLRMLRKRPAGVKTGTIIAWIDYATELLWRLPAVQNDPELPMSLANADLIINGSDGRHGIYAGDTPMVDITHPVDVLGLRKTFCKKAKPQNDPPICLWVYHRWGDNAWPLTIPVIQRECGYRHIIVGLGQGRELASMYVPEVYPQLPQRDYLKMLAQSDLCVDMHPWRSMGRVPLEAAALGVPVMMNVPAQNRIWYWSWDNSWPMPEDGGALQAEAVKNHDLPVAKAELEQAIGKLGG